MTWYNYVIVGSGPAGVAAARRLQRQGVCLFDVGMVPESEFPYSSFGESLTKGDVAALLGPHWEMLANLRRPEQAHAKLRAPGVRYVMQGEPFEIYGADGKRLLHGAGSYAAGGMSNAWGAQLFRYTDTDLAEAGGWPFTAAALESYYKDLETHIGIAGTHDDVAGFLGDVSGLLPPTPIVPAAEHMLKRYSSRRKAKGLHLGRARLAVLTERYHGYPGYNFGETEFYSTSNPSVYTARRTLDELRNAGSIEYVNGHELVAYREHPEYVEIDLHVSVNGEIRTVRARHLLLACGTLHTARLVLLAKRAIEHPLPFIDHPPTLLPLFLPRMFGTALPRRSFPVQLVGTLLNPGKRDMISFYYPGGLLMSDLLADIPLPIDAALTLLPNLLGGMLVAQIWEASGPAPRNRLSVSSDGTIRIDYPQRAPYGRMRPLLAALRRFGAYSLGRLTSAAPPGWGFHYAGCLPHRIRPQPFETHVDGRLWDSMRVRVVDGSVLPSLPAKNHSLTVMANAARIADETRKCGY